MKHRQFMHNISIDTLSVIARQCIAVTCLQRFCQRHALHHQALSAFTEHIWQVTQVGPGDFAAWESGFASLAMTGMGDPWPDDIRMAIPGHLLGTLEQLVQHVLETSACTWYGNDLPESRRQLEAVLDLCARHDVAIPQLAHYVQHDAALRGGWGPALTDEEVRAWKALI
ncbi:hypothetical protein FFI39_020015 [Janthinobacterium sp. KBS0711]|uniref:hypothetical protein n=1 Tax=Janthinobacterium sp. KBS0711 TaxID=1649647 RepID=UPI00110D2783|nr:hypothetical protein [Janthinobacterium sp. KBS0711]TSD73066.1 hypothetical protein FFI39_020015 [Janthinobacterium sp. KBS0711]